MSQVVVDEPAGRRFADKDARAEPRSEGDEQGGGSSYRLPNRSRAFDVVKCQGRHRADEPIPLPGDCLNQSGVRAECDANVANREVDVLVVLDHSVGPERFLNPVAADNLAGVLHEERKQARRLGLQHARQAVSTQRSGRRIECVRAEPDDRGRHFAIIRPVWGNARLDIFLYRNIIGFVPRAATTSDVFNAIAEPVRRDILAYLARDERAVSDVVDALGLNQPSVSKHLKVLRHVGLVDVRRDGRQAFYRANVVALRPVHEWTRTFERYWRNQLARVKTQAEEKASE